MSIERNGAESIGIVRVTRNLFDGILEAGGLYLAGGAESNDPTRRRSVNYIPVKENTKYCVSHTGNLKIYAIGYTESKNGITDGINVSELGRMENDKKSMVVLTSPTTKYIRFETKNIDDVIQLELGTEATPYVPHTIEAMKVVRTTRNLFDKDRINLKNDDFLREDGSIGTQAGVVAYTLDHIPVNGDFVTLSSASGTNLGGGAICLYDGEKNFIRGKVYNNNTTNTPVTFDISGGSYVRFSLRQTASKVQLEIGTIATPYVPHLITAWENQEEGD